MSVRTDSAVAKVAARQKTLATTAQLAECGLDKDAVAYRVHSRRLRVVFRGVYTVSPGELPPLALELAALLACGKDSFISHHSAAFVWGLRATAPPQVEVSVVGRCCDSRKGFVCTESGDPPGRADAGTRVCGSARRRARSLRWPPPPPVDEARATRKRAATGCACSRRASWRRCWRATGAAAAPRGWRRCSATSMR